MAFLFSFSEKIVCCQSLFEKSFQCDSSSGCKRRSRGPDGQDDLLTVALSDYERHVDVSQALIFVAMGVNLMRRNS